MAKQPEGRLQRRIRKALSKQLGGKWVKIHGSVFQEPGIPDLVGCVGGLYIGLEVKRPTKGRVSVVQRDFINEIIENGGAASVVTGEREAIIFVRRAMKAWGVKRCGVCLKVKPLEEFHKHSENGYQGRCKSCHSRHRKETGHERYVAKRYGLSSGNIERMMKDQGSKCALCRKKKKLVIDHRHGTKVVRGLLCHKCNIGLGYFDDDPERFWDAADYLQKSLG